ncbi:MAG TPA: EAL domain-containing protein [Burkholderiales bacterium]|nr:EAL domain-containing protein [Burkholderiales bacterium]
MSDAPLLPQAAPAPDEALAQIQAAMDASPDLFYLVDMEAMRFLYVNQTACRFEKCTREEHLRMQPWDAERITREQLEGIYAQARDRVGEPVSNEYIVSKDGERGWFEVQRRAIRVGERWLLVASAREITQRKLAEQAAVRHSRMYAALSATNEAIMRSKSPEELYQRVCDGAVHGGRFINTAVLLPGERGAVKIVAVSGAAEKALRGARISVDADTPEGGGLVGTAFRSGQPSISNDYLADRRLQPWHAEARAAGIRAGAALPLLRAGCVAGVLLFYSAERRAFDEGIVGLLSRMADNIAFALDHFEHERERKAAEARAQYLATHDALTGLPNRTLFKDLVEREVETARRYGRRFSVLFIDLDRFKFINDTLGHAAGDTLLREMSVRFRAALRSSDIVARLGGDEFVVLAHETDEPGQGSAVARKLLAAAIRPVEIAGQDCRVTASVGICRFPDDAQDEPSLMKHADMAMYLAKQEGKNTYQAYSRGMTTPSLEKMAVETHLRRALERGELALHYQAKKDLQSGAITGVEALLRWTSAELGAIAPAQFIPVAEETGLIIPIGKWVLQTACAQNAAWQRQGLRPVCMAVNLSPRQFTDPDLLADIEAALRDTGMAPALLELEITEGMVMHDAGRAVELLGAIKRLGVRLAIDDFGTGYSSLAQLKRFPIDTLKVDRSFIREIPRDAEDRAITDAIIAMGRTLSLTVVAEGVETEAQQTYLREHLCDEMQGYFFSKPLPAEECAALLRATAT